MVTEKVLDVLPREDYEELAARVRSELDMAKGAMASKQLLAVYQSPLPHKSMP